MKPLKESGMKRPDMTAYFRYRIDWKNKGLMSTLEHPGLPQGVTRINGDVTDREIEVFVGDRVWRWQGGRHSSRKTNGNYPVLMPIPVNDWKAAEMDQVPDTADPLQPNDDWQTRYRGSNDDEYAIYVAAAESLGWPVKSYDEWLQS